VDVPMELSRILISELHDPQIIFLKEKDGHRTFPILIGIAEASAIDRRLKDITTPRPMTHDLLAGVIEAMGGTVEKIVINDLQDHTFVATLHIRQGERIIEVDSRPSDAIALGVGLDTPIFVADHVLKEVLHENIGATDRVELLRRRLDVLAEKITQLSGQLSDEGFLAEAGDQTVQEHRRQLQEMKSEYEAIDRVLKNIE